LEFDLQMHRHPAGLISFQANIRLIQPVAFERRPQPLEQRAGRMSMAEREL
jgi:hypothetical protein